MAGRVFCQGHLLRDDLPLFSSLYGEINMRIENQPRIALDEVINKLRSAIIHR